jgi:hypothetical protein
MLEPPHLEEKITLIIIRYRWVLRLSASGSDWSLAVQSILSRGGKRALVIVL